ncbi:MAG: carboxypeptidase-like regulatory domain-containing protein, partial [Dysgonamonadaceae bacterium]
MKKRVLFFFFGLCLSIATIAQVQVRGNVTDNQGEPIPGVTILEKGTQHGTTTDIDGNYHIAVTGPES